MQQLVGDAKNMVNAGQGGDTVADMNRRIARDVFGWTPRTVIVLGGLNDFGIFGNADAPTTIARLTSIYKNLIHGCGCGVVPVTITPFGASASWTPAKEAIRGAVNSWILGLTSQAIDPAVRAPVNLDDYITDLSTPGRPVWKAGLDAGDHVHPNAAGAAQMAAGISRSFLGH
jgi:lysophospholipase L1-like esterase